MPTPFAALESRSTAAVFKHLSNASALLNGGAVTGIFDAAYEQGSAGAMGMASTMPMFTLPSDSVPANPVGQAFVHAAVAYTVVHAEPDGTGVTRLMLERAA